ncbi:MAG: RteC domain-containing protein [Chitinophagaceae bacterium]
MNELSFYSQFEKLYQEKYARYLVKYHEELEDSTDDYKFQVHAAYLQKIYYNDTQIQATLKEHSHFLSDIKHYCGTHKTSNYQEQFDERMNFIETHDKNKLVDQLAEFEALMRTSTYIRSNEKNIENPYKEYSPLIDPTRLIILPENHESKSMSTKTKNQIKWESNTELEFVQLVYSLFASGYLTNDKQEVTTLVKQVAEAFNIKLGKNWSSNFSKHIHKTDNDNRPIIFETLSKNFQAYKEKTIDKKKKNRSK